MSEIAAKGGAATKAKHDGGGFAAGELTPLVTLEDAKTRLDLIGDAILTRRITDREGNAASKAVSEWVKTEAAAATGRLVNELQKELAEKTREIEVLRKQLAQLAGHSRQSRLRAVP